MTLWERLAWWAMARAVRQYRNGAVDQVWHPRWSAAKTLHLRLDGVLFNEWPHPEAGDGEGDR